MVPKTPPGQTRGQIYRFMRDCLRRGAPPTVREVQEAFGFKAVQSAREHLEGLVAEGKLTKLPGVSRGYRLPSHAQQPPSMMVPVLGRVQAGAFTTAVEETDDYVTVDRSLDDELFALRVRGESMIDLGILPDDLVIVRRQSTADFGDIVVALVEDEATVKTFSISNGRIELLPANPHFEPIIPDPSQLVILGRVIEVRRVLVRH